MMRRIRWLSAAAACGAAVACADANEEFMVVTHFDEHPKAEPAVGPSPGLVAVQAQGTLEQSAVEGLSHVVLVDPATSWVNVEAWAGSGPSAVAQGHSSFDSKWLRASGLHSDLPATGKGTPEEEQDLDCSSDAVFACKATAVPSRGDTEVSCMDSTGKTLFAGSMRSLVESGVCTEADLSALFEVYETETCVRQVPSFALPPSPIVDAFVRPDALPQKVCANVDATRFEWTHTDTTLVYEVERVESGAGDWAQSWSLEMDVYNPFVLETRWFPHLLCETYQAQGAGLTLDVAWEGSTVGILVGEMAAPADNEADPDAFIDTLTANEPVCALASALLQ